MSGLSKIFPGIMSRNMFCEKCAENHMPQVGNLALFFGGQRNSFFFEKIEKDNTSREYGFTPHILINPQIVIMNEKQFVSFFSYCGMHSCGIEVDPLTNQFYYLEHKDCLISAEHFIALMNNKDYSYYVNLFHSGVLLK